MWSNIEDEDVNVNILPNGYPNEIQGLVTKFIIRVHLKLNKEQQNMFFI